VTGRDLMRRRCRPPLAAAALVVLLTLIVLSSRASDWRDGWLLVTLLGLALGCDLLEVSTKSLRLTGSFLALVLGMVLLGPAPAALISTVATLVVLARTRGLNDFAPIALANQLVYPLMGGWGARLALQDGDVAKTSASFLLLVVAVFLVTNVLNFLLVASTWSWADRISLVRRFRQDYLPVLPWELVTALLAAGVAALYEQVGLPALALAAVVILTF